MYTKRQKRSKSANSQGIKKKGSLKKKPQNSENLNLENIDDNQYEPLDNETDLESHKKPLIKKTSITKKKSIMKKKSDSDSDNSEENIKDEDNDEEESIPENKNKIKRLTRSSIKRKRTRSARPLKKASKKTMSQNECSSDEDDPKSTKNELNESDTEPTEQKRKSKPILKNSKSKKRKGVKKNDNVSNKKNETESSSDDESEYEEEKKDFPKANIISDEIQNKSTISENNNTSIDLDDIFDDDSFYDEPALFKKFIYPELTQTKYNICNVSKHGENVFYAFYGAHMEAFFKIAYFCTVFSNKSVLELKGCPVDPNISPISKYEIENKTETEINIGVFTQYLSEQYPLEDGIDLFSCSSDNIEDIINNYVIFMRKLIGEFLYSDKIYTDCTIVSAIKNDLKESQMIPRSVIIQTKDKIEPEVSVEIDIESSIDVEINKTTIIIYKLVWLIDEDGTYVRDDNGSLFYFNNGECNKVTDISSSSKPSYACFSINID